MTRHAMIKHAVHGSDANLLTYPGAYLLTLDCTGGSFKVTLDGVETGAITASATLPTAATLQADLIALNPTLYTANIAVTGSAGGPFTIEFGGALLDTHHVFSTDATLLTGGGSTAVVTEASQDMDAFDNTDGMSCVVTGQETILIHNPSGGSARTVTVPSSQNAQHRLNDTLISTFSIPTPGWLVLPKFKAQGWSQGPEGIHIDASGSGLLYLVLVDPVD